MASPLGISLAYGRALHVGVEAFLRGAARTPAEAVRAAFGGLSSELAKNGRSPGIRWDDYHERTLTGDISQQGNNFGNLPDADFCRFWLARQVPLWILLYGASRVRHSEKALYIPLTPQPGWRDSWSVECWLDFILEVEGGYQITDLKTSSGGWDERDFHKSSKQALLYMGAYAREVGEDPALPFEFHVLPRTKAGLPALELAREWAAEDHASEPGIRQPYLDALLAGGPAKTKIVTVGRGKAAVKTEVPVLDEAGELVLEWTLADALQVWEVPYDLQKVNTYIRGVIRPKIAMIEADAFPANPSGWHCSSRFCDFFPVCAFGEGTLL